VDEFKRARGTSSGVTKRKLLGFIKLTSFTNPSLVK